MNFKFKIEPENIQQDDFYEDKITIRDFNDTYAKKKKLLNNSLIHEISTYLIIGLQNSGKSYFVEQFLENNYDQKKSKIFYLSSIIVLPKYLEKYKNIQVFQDKDFTRTNNPFDEIFGQLQQSMQEKDKKQNENDENNNEFLQAKISNMNFMQKILYQKYGNSLKIAEQKKSKQKILQKYIQFFLIIDDILIPSQFQNSAFTAIMKTYRHYQCAILSTTQSMMVQNSLKIRKMYQTLALFPNLNQKELEQIYFESSLPIKQNQFFEIYYEYLKIKNDYIIIDKRIHPQLFVCNFDQNNDFQKKVTKINMILQKKQ